MRPSVALWVAATLLATPATAQAPAPGASSAPVGHEDGKVCDASGNTCADMVAVADTITLMAGSGDIMSGVSGVDNTATFLGQAGQTDPIVRVESDSGPGFDLEIDSNAYGIGIFRSDNSATAEAFKFYRGSNVLYEMTTDIHSFYSFFPSMVERFRISASNLRTLEPLCDMTDTDTCLALGSSQAALQTSGSSRVDARDTYVEVMGCRDYGSLATPPTPNGACDRYYDTSGAFCVYNGSSWDSIGSGSCS